MSFFAFTYLYSNVDEAFEHGRFSLIQIAEARHTSRTFRLHLVCVQGFVTEFARVGVYSAFGI